LQSSRRIANLHNCTTNKRPESDTSDRREPKDGHWQTSSLVTFPYITDATTNNVDGNRGCTTAEKSGNNERCKVVSKGRAEQEQLENDVRNLPICQNGLLYIVNAITYEVAGHTASVLGQRYEQKWEKSSTHVPAARCPIEIGKRFILNAEASCHPFVTSTIGSSGETR
jgi:hypothetical protein